jgi:hypothetical protein
MLWITIKKIVFYILVVLSTDLSAFLLYRSPYVEASRSAGVTTGSEKSCPFGLRVLAPISRSRSGAQQIPVSGLGLRAKDFSCPAQCSTGSLRSSALRCITCSRRVSVTPFSVWLFFLLHQQFVIFQIHWECLHVIIGRILELSNKKIEFFYF